MDRKHKRALTWILMTIVICAISFLFYKDYFLGQFHNALYGRGIAEYYLLSATKDSELWALGREDSGAYILAEGNNGNPGWRNEMESSALPERVLIESLFAVSDTEALLEVTKIDDKGMYEAGQLFLVSEKGKKLTPLLSVSCTGNTPEERQESVVFGTFVKYQGKICFVVWKNGTAFSYEISPETWELRMALSFQCDSFQDAMVTKGGEVGVISSEGEITLYSTVGVPKYVLRTGTSITKVYSGSDGSFYYFDHSDGTINQVMERDSEYYLVQKIPADMYSVMTVQENGTVYYIEDGRLYEDAGAKKDITSVLYGPSWLSWLKLILWFVASMMLAYLIALFLNGKKHRSILAKSALYVVLSMIALVGTIRSYILPLQEKAVLQIARQNLEITTGMGLRMTGEAYDGDIINEPASHTWQALSDAGFYDSSITLYQYADNGFKVMDTTSETAEIGNVVTGSSLLITAPSSGTVSEIRETLNGPVCSCVSSDGRMLMEVNANLSGIKLGQTESNRDFMTISVTTAGLLLLLLFSIVLSVWFSIRNISKGVYAITEGDYDVVISNPSGDELESMATAINNMTLVLKQNREKMAAISEWYNSFMPKGLFSLLSSKGEGNIGLGSYASYDFLLLSVFIWKADTLNSPLNTEQTMEEINQLLSEFIRITEERKAISISVGGRVAVFGFEAGRLSSALEMAVSFREALDILNTERAEQGLGPIVIKMVLDFGKTDVGIVGVPEQMFAIALSDRKLHMDLIHQLEVIMGVTMIVTGTALENGKADDCRYLGTYVFEDGTEKLYEVFSGDEFLLARRKRETMEEFDRGVEAFYRKDFTEAKRIFLELVRSGSGKDGAARYYLNLSDRYENNPNAELGLQCGINAPVRNSQKRGLS